MTDASRGTVLIVEDDNESAALLSELVQREGFQAAVCGTASEALAVRKQLKPVAVLLDWGLPDGPGLEVCRLMRTEDAAMPILFVSGRDDEASIARGLDAGADDYMSKPIRPGELMARLEAHLRRVAALRNGAHGTLKETHARHARFGAVEVDLDAREVSKGGRALHLGALEFKLLEYLMTNTGTAVSRDQILGEVYGYDADAGSERVDLLVRRLRAKLGEEESGDFITAVPGYGYRLERRGA